MENATNNGELMEIFYEETQRLLDEMRQDMSTLSQEVEARDQITSADKPSALSDNASADESPVLRRLFRCAHIIRSSSRAVGLEGLEQVSRALERIFKKAGDDGVAMGGDTLSLLCEGIEACQKLLNDEEVVGRKELTDRLDAILQPCGG